MDSNLIFRFLRQFLYDKELEETKIQLAESKILLAEYKDFIQNEKKNQDNEAEKKKVDPDFLVMLWASIGLALSIGVEATNNFPKGRINFSQTNLSETVWFIIACLVFLFVIINGLFAINLTIDYAKSKEDKGYKIFAFTLISGIALVFIGIMVIAQLGQPI